MRRIFVGALTAVGLFASGMVGRPFVERALGEQVCIGILPANLASLQQAVVLYNTRMKTQLTQEQFILQALRQATLFETTRNLNEQAEAVNQGWGEAAPQMKTEKK